MMFPVRSYPRLSRNSISLVVFFAVLPFAYAFGTNNNYWSTAADAGLFWFLSGFAFCAAFAAADAAWHKLLPAAALVLVVSTGVLYSSMENPYRQTQPLRLQMTPSTSLRGNRASFCLRRRRHTFANFTGSRLQMVSRQATLHLT